MRKSLLALLMLAMAGLAQALGYTDREVGRLYLDNYFWLVVASLAVSILASLAIMGQVWRLMTAHLPIGIPYSASFRVRYYPALPCRKDCTSLRCFRAILTSILSSPTT